MSKNLAASVRQRLTNKAKETNRPFQELLQYFAMERFLYRLAQSRHAAKFILKGALMFTAWSGKSSRPTKDIDLLAHMDNAVEAVEEVIREVCGQVVEADGLVFDVESAIGSASRRIEIPALKQMQLEAPSGPYPDRSPFSPSVAWASHFG
jgi:hypothetical protein